MKHKVAELEGALLDFFVAKADGRATFDILDDGRCYASTELWRDGVLKGYATLLFEPSTSWSTAGPIIERERITVQTWPDHWAALWYGPGSAVGAVAKGQTPLIAAMRAFVASKLGEEVELP